MKYSNDFVGSSMLSSATYDDETHEMTVTFAGGKTYTYEDVEQYYYETLCSAPSAGKYFNGIKGQLKVKAE